MNNRLKLNTYSYFPNITKLGNSTTSEYDFIAFGFEASFKSEFNDAKNSLTRVNEKNVFFMAYLFVDHYVELEGKSHTAINFDMGCEETTGNTFKSSVYYSNYKKDSPKSDQYKTIEIQDNEKVKLKNHHSIEVIDQYPNLSNALTSFYKEQIESSMATIEKFLKKSAIEYDKNDLNSFLCESLKEASKLFTLEGISYLVHEEVQGELAETNSMIQLQHLQRTLANNSTAPKKIKI